MIKNIVFDMGNVLLDYNPARFVSEFTSSENEKKILIKEIFEAKEWIEIDKGIIQVSDVEFEISSRVPEYLKSKVTEVLRNWYKYFDEIDGIEKLLKDLREKGYSLYILSNAGSQIKEYRDRDIFKNFDGMIFSSEVKLLKPDKKIFKRLFKRFSIQPEESYFIDDVITNIEVALTMGMKGYNFTTKDVDRDLREKLVEEGIL